MKATIVSVFSAGLLVLVPPGSFAAPVSFTSTLETLNSSGVTGFANLTQDDTAHTLTVDLHSMGLTPNQIHPIHIHGFPGNVRSVIPTLQDDTDGDKFIELLEGQVRYGPIILNVAKTTHPTGPSVVPLAQFPTATAGGQVDFLQTYTFDLTNPDEKTIYDLLHPLDFRHIVIHGLFINANADGTIPGANTPGEVDGTLGYKAVLPVANGNINLASRAVPEPSALLLLGSGLLGIVVWRKTRRML